LAIEDLILTAYLITLSILFFYGMHGFFLVYLYNKFKEVKYEPKGRFEELPKVCIQLPVYNEALVVDRLIEAVCKMNYPKEKMEIQVLDDSTDETQEVLKRIVEEKKKENFNIIYHHRDNRYGFKAGALKEGLEMTDAEFIAIFDADFIPNPEFLNRTIHYFTDPKVGMVQTRWEHLNDEYSLLTRAQALALDGHFVMEQQVRNKAGFFINFNGTAGIWRKSCILDAGNWQPDTLTEDLDLSYRAQLKGWKFIFINDFTSPSELPIEINALKNQQFRWTKGAIETAKKILPLVWKSSVPLKIKLYSTFHLTMNIVFPLIVIAGLLAVPLVYVKNTGNYDEYFAFMSIFTLAFISSFLMYMYSQKDVYPDWKRRIYLFPVFMAGSMGFALNNTKAVIEGLLNKKSEFVRTPKFRIESDNDNPHPKKKKYAVTKISPMIVIELIFALWALFGIGLAAYYTEIAAIPFLSMYFLGYGVIAVMSIKHALESKK
jgi:cellulose synthase/poly-beta-1,6-N-acetylglucosamine synthase-like glycosyltransferase